VAIQARPMIRHATIVGASQGGLTLDFEERCGGV
jgi:hypothetical protein